MFKTEMHSHTKQSSHCSKIYAKNLIYNIKELGYKSIVITDHYDSYAIREWKISNKSEDPVDLFLKGYLRAKEYGEKLGINVLLGMELEQESRNMIHYLIYGMTEDFLREYPNLYQYSQSEIYKLCNENDMLLYEAHPLRDFFSEKMKLVGEVDGFEVYNQNHTKVEKNIFHPHMSKESYQKYYEKIIEINIEYAEENNLSVISGGDRHAKNNDGNVGILTPNEIKTNNDLVKVLKSKNYNILR